MVPPRPLVDRRSKRHTGVYDFEVLILEFFILGFLTFILALRRATQV